MDLKSIKLATKFADAMIGVVKSEKDIFDKLPNDMDAFFELVKGIFGLKFAAIVSEMDDVQEAVKEDDELAGILELLKVIGVK